VTATALCWVATLSFVGCAGSFLYAAYHTIRFQNWLWDAHNAGTIPDFVSLRAALLFPGSPHSCIPPQKRALAGIGAFIVCWLSLAISLLH